MSVNGESHNETHQFLVQQADFACFPGLGPIMSNNSDTLQKSVSKLTSTTKVKTSQGLSAFNAFCARRNWRTVHKATAGSS